MPVTTNKRIVLPFVLLSLIFQTQVFANRSVVKWWTSKGTFKVLIREDLVPLVTYRFLTLVDQNYYDNLTFHTIEPDDAVYSGKGSTLIDTTRHQFDDSLAFDSAGVIGLYHNPSDKPRSEYFITLRQNNSINDTYSAFGCIIDGMDIVKEIGTTSNDEVTIDSVRVVERQDVTITRSVCQWYTSMGTYKVQIREDLIPFVGVKFLSLVNMKYYDGTNFYRVIEDFMNEGGRGEHIEIKPNLAYHDSLLFNVAGIIGIGHYGHDTNCPEYFITCAKTTWLNKEYSAFGYVIEGMDVVHAINSVETEIVGEDSSKPVIEVIVDSVRLIEQVTGTIDIPEKQFHDRYAQITFDSFIRPNGNVVITFNNPEKNIFTLNVINALGKLVKVFTNISDNKFEIKKSLLAEGVYFIELKGLKIYRGKVLIRN